VYNYDRLHLIAHNAASRFTYSDIFVTSKITSVTNYVTIWIFNSNW